MKIVGVVFCIVMIFVIIVFFASLKLAKEADEHMENLLKGQVNLIQAGNYEDITLRSTTIEELKPYQNEKGKLHIDEDNNVTFEFGSKRFVRKAIQTMGDFTLLSCRDLWINTKDGDINFSRKNQNPLWELERGEDDWKVAQ